MAKKQKLDLEKLAKKAEKEAKDLLEKDSFSSIESVGTVPLGVSITSSGTTISVDSSVIVKEDPMYDLIKRVVKEVLFEEKVLINIGGKAKEYSPDSIAISKFDPDVKTLTVKTTKPKDPEPSINILEELEKIR